jgi:DNA-binding transcriptional MerR regulator
MDSASKMVFPNQEVMEQLDVSTAVLKKWRDSGLLGYSQINNKYYYSRDDIVEFMKTTHYEAFVTREKRDSE